MLTAIELEAIKTTLNRTGFLNRRHAEMLIRDVESRIAAPHEQTETVENVIEQPVDAPARARNSRKGNKKNE